MTAYFTPDGRSLLLGTGRMSQGATLPVPGDRINLATTPLSGGRHLVYVPGNLASRVLATKAELVGALSTVSSSVEYDPGGRSWHNVETVYPEKGSSYLKGDSGSGGMKWPRQSLVAFGPRPLSEVCSVVNSGWYNKVVLNPGLNETVMSTPISFVMEWFAKRSASATFGDECLIACRSYWDAWADSPAFYGSNRIWYKGSFPDGHPESISADVINRYHPGYSGAARAQARSLAQYGGVAAGTPTALPNWTPSPVNGRFLIVSGDPDFYLA